MKKIRKILSNLILYTSVVFLSFILFFCILGIFSLYKDIETIYSDEEIIFYKQDLKLLKDNVDKIEKMNSNIYSEEDLNTIKRLSKEVVDKYEKLFINNFDNTKDYKIIDTLNLEMLIPMPEIILTRYLLSYENGMEYDEFFDGEKSLRKTNEKEYNKILNNSILYNNIITIDTDILNGYEEKRIFIMSHHNYIPLYADYLTDYKNIKNMIEVTNELLNIGGNNNA